MRLLILSDLHREIWYRSGKKANDSTDPYPRTDLAVAQPDVVILAGDIHVGSQAVEWADQSFPGLPVLYVHGNHEGYGKNIDDVQQDIAEACAATDHVYFLDCRKVVLDDVRFLGATLWTDFRLHGSGAYQKLAMYDAGQNMNDYQRIRLAKKGYRKLRPEDSERWHYQHRRWLRERLAESFDGKTVVITHMAPSEQSIAEEYLRDRCAPAFASNLDDLVEQVDLWVHGHTHHSVDYRIGKCRVISNPLGYPGSYEQMRPENPHFDPNLIVEI